MKFRQLINAYSATFFDGYTKNLNLKFKRKDGELLKAFLTLNITCNSIDLVIQHLK